MQVKNIKDGTRIRFYSEKGSLCEGIIQDMGPTSLPKVLLNLGSLTLHPHHPVIVEEESVNWN